MTLLALADLLRSFDDRGLHELLTGLIDQASTDPLVQLLALATAAGAGVMHALGPGHGKTLVGGYLASSQGRARDAVALGSLVALMHTGSVLVLGLVFHTTSRAPIGPGLDAALSLVSAAAITAVGVVLVVRQLRARRAREQRRTSLLETRVPAAATASGPAPGTAPGTAAPTVPGAGPPPGAHAHDHLHDHHHDLPAGVAPLSRAGLLALATSGGLLPSPAAFALLVTSLALGRSGYGLALLAAFSVGLALTLAAVGLAVVFGRDRIANHAGRHHALTRVARIVPFAGAAIVLGGGLVMLGFNLVRLVT
jgi:nickel/cobalt transporter (NicO) family protein